MDKKGFYTNEATRDAQTSTLFVRECFDKFLNYINTKQFNNILDLGSGVGYNLSSLIKRGRNIYAVDISRSALEMSKYENQDLDLAKIKFIVADAQALPLTGQSIELTVCTEVLEHVDDLTKVVQEIYRVTKKNGYIIISTPNYLNLIGLYKKYKDWRAGKEYWEPWGAHRDGFERFITSLKLEKLLKTIGFKILKTQAVDYAGAWFFFLPYGKSIIRKLLIPLSTLPFFKKIAQHYFILAQK